MNDRIPECKIQCDEEGLYVLIDGLRIATRVNRQWISIEPGYEVRQSGRKLWVTYNGWPAPGFKDTELGVSMEPEVGHGETEVYPRV